MLPKILFKSTSADSLTLIESAQNAELCRDIETLQEILQPVWADFTRDPEFDFAEPAINAELLRISGVFLSFYGNAHNLKNYQERSKDLLTRAARIFDESGLTDKAAETSVKLAFCYWNAGEIEEAEAMLDLVELDFGKNLLHPVYLQICINRLLIFFYRADTQSAIELLDQLTAPMQFSSDLRLKAMFHNQAGIFYTNINEFEKSVFHLTEAIRYAGKIGNRLYVAINYNNLAFLYKETGDFAAALKYIGKSIEVLTALRHQGMYPHALDTKALIYLDRNDARNALTTINQAIELFARGDDARGLTDALWTKCRCLLRLKQTVTALKVFGELQTIAAARIGGSATGKFAEKLAAEVYISRGLSLAEEVAQFKKERISSALIETGGAIGKAAEILQIKSHQALSDTLKNQFPTLYTDLGFQTRLRRSDSQKKPLRIKKISSERKVIIKKSDTCHEAPKISRLILRDKDFSFDFRLESDQFETFYFDRYFMLKDFGIDDGAVVAVVPIGKITENQTILAARENSFVVGQVKFDRWSSIFFIDDESGAPLPVDSSNIVGLPVGYCPYSQVENTQINFSRLIK